MGSDSVTYLINIDNMYLKSEWPITKITNKNRVSELVPSISGIKFKTYKKNKKSFIRNISNDRIKMAMILYSTDKLSRSKSISSKASCNKSFHYLPKKTNYSSYAKNLNVSLIQEKQRRGQSREVIKYNHLLESRLSSKSGINKSKLGLNSKSFLYNNYLGYHTRTGLRHDLYERYPRMF